MENTVGNSLSSSVYFILRALLAVHVTAPDNETKKGQHSTTLKASQSWYSIGGKANWTTPKYS